MRYERPIHYNQNSGIHFQRELRQKMDVYFSENKIEKTATGFMWFKVLLFVSSYWILWAALTFKVWSLPVTALLFVGLSVVTIFVAFNVSHDAVHCALSGKSKIDNFIFYWTFNFLGPNAYLWRIRHLNAHHFFVNVPGSDMDIEGTNLLRVAPHIAWKPAHRFQHLYCSFFYALFTMHWIFVKDFKILRMKSFGSMTDLQHHPLRMVEMILWKIAYAGMMIAFPMMLLPYSGLTIALAFVSFHLLTSFLLLVLFAMSHISLDSHYVPTGKDGKVSHSFLEHQLLTSVDYNSQSPTMGFFLGGFNNHVAHHMFPVICSVHCIPITRMIAETAAKHNLPYREMGFWSLLKSHYGLMKELGRLPDSGQRFVVVASQEVISEEFEI
ncbi:MAG: fatty acid desaturase [Pseudobdellovibrionaceae bacterium]